MAAAAAGILGRCISLFSGLTNISFFLFIRKHISHHIIEHKSARVQVKAAEGRQSENRKHCLHEYDPVSPNKDLNVCVCTITRPQTIFQTYNHQSIKITTDEGTGHPLKLAC